MEQSAEIKDGTATVIDRNYTLHETTVTKQVNPHFLKYVNDWNYRTYLSFGGYGSSKSYHTALKLILKLMQEPRKALVMRHVYDTHRDSTFSLIKEIVKDMGMAGYDSRQRKEKNKIQIKSSPMKFEFPNGSEIIFRGADDENKLKSLNGVSIVWIEEATEISYAVYKEIRKRLRTPNVSVHFLLTFNPVGVDNWVYKHFFINQKTVDGEVIEDIIQDPEELYKRRIVYNPRNGVYYHHSIAKDNVFLKFDYLKELYETKQYDFDLWRIAWLGKFGVKGKKVLPQFTVATNAKEFVKEVRAIPQNLHFVGMDFGFEESFNAVVRCAVDEKNNYLYIYDEPVYMNDTTDDVTAKLPSMQKLKKEEVLIHADSAEPKTIKYYRLQGYRMKGAKKFQGSRVAYTKKIKRFKKIICSPRCVNCIKEMKDLTYAVDKKTGEMKDYGEFNIDPHTFSALWYALEDYEPRELKIRNSKEGMKEGRVNDRWYDLPA